MHLAEIRCKSEIILHNIQANQSGNFSGRQNFWSKQSQFKQLLTTLNISSKTLVQVKTNPVHKLNKTVGTKLLEQNC
jgi:hypothetical protein